MPCLRVMAGPSMEELAPIEPNSDIPLDISSDAFEGQMAVYIKGFADADGKVVDSPYFEQLERKHCTWSIQVQGKFLQPHSADDILFGNIFDRPLQLPWGFSAILNFMQYIDPTLEQDLASQSRPWVLSPLISTMPHFEHTRIEELHQVPPFPPLKPLGENISQLRVVKPDGKTEILDAHVAGNRRSHFKNAERRKEVILGPQDLVTMDFCYGYLSFGSEIIELRLPGGISFDMMKYWDGQPVRFVCCERKQPGDNAADDVPWGRVFWCVQIEVVDDNTAS